MKTTIRKSKSLLAVVLACLFAASMLGTMPAQVLGEPAGTDPPVPFGTGGTDPPVPFGTARTDPVVPFGTTGTDPEQVLKLIVRTTDNNPTFQIPTCSYLNGTYGGKPYNWAIDWGDGATEVRSGTSSQYGGIPHTYASAGDYTITITPNGSVEAWLGAFGFGTGFIGVNEIANKRMIISVPSLLTPQMTRTTAQIDGKEPAPDSEWYYTFDYCVYLTEAPVFAGWESIRNVGNSFAAGMFSYCSGLKDLPQGFTFPQDLTVAGDSFAAFMFDGCNNLTRLPDSFNFPQGLCKAGDGFACYMFFNCYNLTKLPEGFNLPQGFTEAGHGFAMDMFNNCANLIELPEGFNLPQGITEVGDNFAGAMFHNCTSLTGLPEGFNLPQDIVLVGSGFASFMFHQSGGSAFQINDEFRFPAGIPSDSDMAFYLAFAFSDSVPTQNRAAASIIGDCPTPNLRRYTFNDRFSDIGSIDIKWGGGLIVLIPGSGDLDGDGVITIEEVLTTARVAIGYTSLSPEQLAVIDIDRDGAITMADVLMVYQLAIM